MFNCIKSFSYKMNISANQVSNALRMKALGNTKPCLLYTSPSPRDA